MAMVTISKGDKKLKVSLGAYNGQYKRAGWKLEKPQKAKAKHVDDADNGSTEVDEWDKADEELAKEENGKKDVDDMSMGELKKLAESKGIDTKEIKTIGALKKALKEVM